MLSTLVGAAFLLFGVSLIGNFWNVAGRIFERVSDFVNDGFATVNTVRLIGIFVVIIGVAWGAKGMRGIL